MADAPLRKIICTCNSYRRTRRGILRTATLECGHLDTVNAAERRRGKVHCFDCLYGKTKHPQGVITLEEIDQQRGWERAMGMRGYAGSPAEAEDRRSRRPQ